MRLACGGLLADFRWGPEYAWRRLLCCWRQRFPVSRRTPLDLKEADQQVLRIMAEYARGVCDALARELRQRQATPECVWVSSLFRGGCIADLLQSTAAAAGLRIHCLPLSLVEWLPALATPAEQGSWVGGDGV